MRSSPLLTPDDAARDIVVWANVSPADGSIGLYTSDLAATFEDRLVAFASTAPLHRDDFIQVPFELPLPNGTTLNASMRFQKQADDKITIEQLTGGGHRWAMRLILGAADDLQLPAAISVGVKEWCGEGGFGGHKYATSRGADVWFVECRAALRHLLLASPAAGNVPLEQPVTEALLPESQRQASAAPLGPWAGNDIRDAERIRARVRAFARSLSGTRAAMQGPVEIAKLMMLEWETAAAAIRSASHHPHHHLLPHRSSHHHAPPVESSDTFRACSDEFSRQLVHGGESSLGVLRQFVNDPRGAARAELQLSLSVVQWLSVEAMPKLSHLAPLGSRLEPHRILIPLIDACIIQLRAAWKAGFENLLEREKDELTHSRNLVIDEAHHCLSTNGPFDLMSLIIEPITSLVTPLSVPALTNHTLATAAHLVTTFAHHARGLSRSLAAPLLIAAATDTAKHKQPRGASSSSSSPQHHLTSLDAFCALANNGEILVEYMQRELERRVEESNAPAGHSSSMVDGKLELKHHGHHPPQASSELEPVLPPPTSHHEAFDGAIRAGFVWITTPKSSLSRWANTTPRPHMLTLRIGKLQALPAAGDAYAPRLASIAGSSHPSLRVELAKHSAAKKWRPKKEGCTENVHLPNDAALDGTSLDFQGREVQLSLTLYERKRKHAGQSPYTSKPCAVKVIASTTEIGSVVLDIGALADSDGVGTITGKPMCLPIYRSAKGSKSKLLGSLTVIVSCTPRVSSGLSDGSDAESIVESHFGGMLLDNVHDDHDGEEQQHHHPHHEEDLMDHPATIAEVDDEGEEGEAGSWANQHDEMPPPQDGADIAAAEAVASSMRAANEAAHEALTVAEDAADNCARAGVQALAVHLVYGPLAAMSSSSTPASESGGAPFPHPTRHKPLAPEHLPHSLAHAAHNLTVAAEKLTPINRKMCERLVLRLCVAHCLDTLLDHGIGNGLDETALCELITRSFGGYAQARRAREEEAAASSNGSAPWHSVIAAALAPLVQLGSLRQQLSACRGLSEAGASFPQAYAAFARRFNVTSRGAAESLSSWILSLSAPAGGSPEAVREFMQLVATAFSEAPSAVEAARPRSVPEGWTLELLDSLEGALFAFALARFERDK